MYVAYGLVGSLIYLVSVTVIQYAVEGRAEAKGGGGIAEGGHFVASF